MARGKLNRGQKNTQGPAESRYEKVESWFDIVHLEHGVLDFWKKANAFEKLRKRNEGNKRFSFLDGPITANNPMGVHHAWGRTYKDAYQRYWAMNGRDQRYQNGFDCQGLWVEVEVEKEHNFTTKQEIEEYGIDRFVEECKARVLKYSSIQTDQSIRLGMWMDWDNSYYTMSDENNYTIWTFLKKCHERGKIYRGTDVMPWSGRSGCAYSHMEVIEGRKLVAHTALFLKFPLRERPEENLLVWTTTPWTLTSNVAAAVNVDLDYVKIRAKNDGEIYYFAAENLEFPRLEKQFREKREWVEGVPKLKTIAQIFNERGGYEVLGSVKGEELVGLTYDGPFDELEAQSITGGFPFTDDSIDMSAREAHRIIDGGKDSLGNPVVVAGEGTGIVHVAPGCGDIDHRLGKQLGLPQIAPLDDRSDFMKPFGFLAGKNAVAGDTVEAILDNLAEKGLLIATEQYPHVYPHCWRTGVELVFRLVEEWYIDMDWREEIAQVVDDIRWIPSWGRDRELEWLENMHDWMISKKRFWGLALPIWVCGKCGSFEVIGSKDELKERAIEGWDAFEGHSPHRPWIDAVKIACPECGSESSRIPDVGNPWLDAGIVPYSTVKYNTDRNYWEKWIPADLVLECFPGQFRNWFYSLLALSTMMEGIAPFKTLKGYALMRDEQGEEMHKSAGNAIWFDDAAEEAGTDVMRWLFVRQEPTTNLNFGYGPLRQIRGKFINTLWNTYGFYINYARILGFVPGEERIPFEERPDFDRWILTELQGTIARCRKGFEDYDIRSAALAIEEFMEHLSNWYVRHNRRRFWLSLEDPDGMAAFETLFECLDTVVRLAAPMIPFITEEMYQNMVKSVNGTAPESIHHTVYPSEDVSHVDRELSEDMQAVIRLHSLALSARESTKIKVRQPLSSLAVSPADDIEDRAVRRFSDMIRENLNVKELEILESSAESPLIYDVKPNFKSLGPRVGKRMKDVAEAIENEKQRLVEEFKNGAEGVSLSVDGMKITLEKDDLQFQEVQPEGRVVAEDGKTWVSFDTTLTDELREEGLMRDLLRQLQVLRKEEGLEIEDRITMNWDTDSTSIEAVFERFEELLTEELLITELSRLHDLEEGREITVGSETVRVSITKAGS